MTFFKGLISDSILKPLVLLTTNCEYDCFSSHSLAITYEAATEGGPQLDNYTKVDSNTQIKDYTPTCNILAAVWVKCTNK